MAVWGPSKRVSIKNAKAAIADAVALSMNAVVAGLKDRTDEEMKASFDLPRHEAPMWTHVALGLAQAAVKADQQAGPSVTNQLNLVLVDKAKDNATWLESVEKFKEVTGGERKAIEAKATVKEK